MKKNVKKVLTLALSLAMALSLAACGGGNGSAGSNVSGASGSSQMPEPGTVFKIGICNYVDDASLNQINENIQARLGELGAENGVSFNIDRKSVV